MGVIPLVRVGLMLVIEEECNIAHFDDEKMGSVVRLQSL